MPDQMCLMTRDGGHLFLYLIPAKKRNAKFAVCSDLIFNG